jgi:hypothetical protein
MKPASWRWLLLLAQLLLWTTFALIAYERARAYSFASCWQLILFYMPALGFLMIGIGTISVATLILSVFCPRQRSRRTAFAAAHGTVLVAGPVMCSVAAHAAVAQADCL